MTTTKILAISAVLAFAVVGQTAAQTLSDNDVLLKAEMENYGRGVGLTAVERGGASGGVAMAMDENAHVAAGVNLDPGDYTLLLRTFAPAGDADGFFVTIAGARTRRVAPIGRWASVAFPFRVEQAGVIPIIVLGQEPGMTVDQVAVVRGQFKDDQIDVIKLPAPARDRTADLSELPLHVLPVRLNRVPDTPFEAAKHTIYHENFEEPFTGASGESHVGDGRWGKGLHLNLPDGRYDVDATGWNLGATGTIEWWVRPRPAAQAWWDQGWRFFLHVRPARAGGFQLDLWRHPITSLRLTASMGLQPFGPIDAPDEKIELGTRSVDIDAWYHLLVSWDLTGERQRIWLLLDGEGRELSVPAGTFTPGPFASIEFGNRPSGWATPHIPMDGGIDEVHVSNRSISGRLAQ